MKYIDVFNKYYSLDKLPQGNNYYNLKKNNYEQAKLLYDNNDIELPLFPIRATIQTTEFCNLNCIMCQIHSQRQNRKLRSMNKNNFDRIVEQLFPYLVEIHPTNIGEPLMSEWFEYLCDKVVEYGILLDITTNGMLLNEHKIYKILHNLLDIKISFDGIKKETYETIRKNSNYDTVVKNIDLLLEIKRRERAQGTVTLQMTLFEFNYLELIDVIKFAHRKGIDGVKAYHVFSYSDEINKFSLFNNLEQFEETRMASINLANELNIKLEISEPNNGKIQNLICQKCRLPWTECWIDLDGEIYSCHSHDNISLGNIYSSDFQSIWNSDYAKRLRKSLINENIKTICTKCGMNYIKYDENQAVPYNESGYLHNFSEEPNSIRWSSRSKQFLLRR
jgi:radical SAM protein with 4Fe4S-binding SPASM domain